MLPVQICYTSYINGKRSAPMINLNAWFQKHGLCAENILYIYRKDRKTVIQRTDGAEFALFVPVHSVLSTLPEKNFLSISKGIVVCRRIFISSPMFQFVIYSLSRRTTSSKSVISLRPLTCHMPVIPGLIASLARW